MSSSDHMGNMDAVFFRHGEKENEFGDDPDLSAQGRAQAEGLLRLVRGGTLPIPAKLFVSEKIRTSQTLAFVRDHYRVPQTKTAELNPKSSSENTQNFLRRVERWLQSLDEISDCFFVCTHIDVMSAILISLGDGADDFVRAGGYTHAQFLNGEWHVLERGVLSGHP